MPENRDSIGEKVCLGGRTGTDGQSHQPHPSARLAFPAFLDRTSPALLAPTLSPSPSPAWQVFGGLDAAGRYVGWAGGEPAKLTRLALFPAIPDKMFPIYARVQAYYGPTLRWDYYIQRSGGWQFVMDIAFWRDESNVWMEIRWDNDANALADVPVEEPALLDFLNTPIARVVAPPVPEPALAQMGALSLLGALGLARLRRKA